MIRTATIEDADAIAEFNAEMARETEGLELDRNRLLAGVKAILSDSSKGIYFVCTENQKVIGQLMITWEWSDWRNANFAWIQSVYVAKDHRRQNVFQNLYAHVKTMVENNPNYCGIRLYVDKKNTVAQAAYSRMGMKPSHYIFYEWEKENL